MLAQTENLILNRVCRTPTSVHKLTNLSCFCTCQIQFFWLVFVFVVVAAVVAGCGRSCVGVGFAVARAVHIRGN